MVFILKPLVLALQTLSLIFCLCACGDKENLIINLPLSKIYCFSPANDPTMKFNEEGVLETYYAAHRMGWKVNPEAVSRGAIGALAYYISHKKDPKLLKMFWDQVNYLKRNLKALENGCYGWVYDFDYRAGQCYELKAPWLSGLAQAQGIATLARAWYLTNDKEYIDLIRKALQTLLKRTNEGGLTIELAEDALWIEEYPTKQPSFVLNGFIYTIYALHETRVLCSPELVKEFDLDNVLEKLRNGLLLKLKDYSVEENGITWSTYDLFQNKPPLHIKLFPTQKLKESKNVQILMHEARLGTPAGEQIINVGDASDTNLDTAHVNDNELYSLGKRETIDGWSYRNLFGEKGRFENSVFTFYLDASTLYTSDLYLTLTFRETGENSLKDDDLVLIQMNTPNGNVLVGYLKGVEKGGTQTISYNLPLEKVLEIAHSNLGKRNLQKSYHFAHMILLSHWPDIWPEDYDVIQKTLKAWVKATTHPDSHVKVELARDERGGIKPIIADPILRK